MSDALFNIYKPMKFRITYRVRKETISHLIMDINLSFYAIICLNKRFKSILKMLVTIGNLVTWQFHLVYPLVNFNPIISKFSKMKII